MLAKPQKAVSETNDCAIGLMGLWLVELGLADATRLAVIGVRFQSAQNLWGANWLLCYEGNFQGWFGAGGRARLQTNPAFAQLESRDVSFLDKTVVSTTAQVTNTFGFGGGGSGDD